MHPSIVWPLTHNVIRRRIENHTFGMVRKNADGTPRAHQGWDFEAKVGTPARAVGAGTVAFVREDGDYGLQLCIAFELDGTKYWAFYAHLDKVLVAFGDAVQRGQVICHTGESGNALNMPADDQHLHFELRTSPNRSTGLDNRVSPIKIFGICPLKVPIDG